MRLNFWLAYRMLFSKQVLFGGSAPLSFLGLILGVAALVVSMAVMSGYVETLKTAMTDITGDLQVVKHGKLVENWESFSKTLREISTLDTSRRILGTNSILSKASRARSRLASLSAAPSV